MCTADRPESGVVFRPGLYDPGDFLAVVASAPHPLACQAAPDRFPSAPPDSADMVRAGGDLFTRTIKKRPNQTREHACDILASLNTVVE